jgi:hypothetical protein
MIRQHGYGSRRGTIRSIGSKIGCTPQTLHSWTRDSASGGMERITSSLQVRAIMAVMATGESSPRATLASLA